MKSMESFDISQACFRCVQQKVKSSRSHGELPVGHVTTAEAGVAPKTVGSSSVRSYQDLGACRCSCRTQGLLKTAHGTWHFNGHKLTAQ